MSEKKYIHMNPSEAADALEARDRRIEKLEAKVERVLMAEVGEVIYNPNVLIRELPNVYKALENSK